MNEVRSTSELAAARSRARKVSKLIVLLQEVKETRTSVFDGIRRVLVHRDPSDRVALARRLQAAID